MSPRLSFGFDSGLLGGDLLPDLRQIRFQAVQPVILGGSELEAALDASKLVDEGSALAEIAPNLGAQEVRSELAAVLQDRVLDAVPETDAILPFNICVRRQGASGNQRRFSLINVLARMMSFRITAVSATFGFFRASTRRA